MALQTGSGQLSQRVDPGLVDPRLLGADLSRIGMGVEQGMGMANNFATMRENAQMRPIRGALANFELAKAEEFAAQAANRGALANFELANAENRRALDEANLARMPMEDEAAAFDLKQAQLAADIKAQQTVVLDNLGTFERGGGLNSVGLAGTEFQFNPEVTGNIQRVLLPNGETVVREIPTGGRTRAQVMAAANSQESKNANQQAQLELQQARVDIARQNAEVALAKLQAGGEAGDGEVRQFTNDRGQVLLGVYSARLGRFITPPQIVEGAIATSYDPLTGLIREAVDRRAGGSAGKPAARNTGAPAAGNTGAPRSAADNFIYGPPPADTPDTPVAGTPAKQAVDAILKPPASLLASVTQETTPRNNPRTGALASRAAASEKKAIAEAKATVAEIEQILAQGGVSRTRGGGRGGSGQGSGVSKLTPGEAKEYEKRYAEAKAKLAAVGI
jgi:hypothetical protein